MSAVVCDSCYIVYMFESAWSIAGMRYVNHCLGIVLLNDYDSTTIIYYRYVINSIGYINCGIRPSVALHQCVHVAQCWSFFCLVSKDFVALLRESVPRPKSFWSPEFVHIRWNFRSHRISGFFDPKVHLLLQPSAHLNWYSSSEMFFLGWFRWFFELETVINFSHVKMERLKSDMFATFSGSSAEICDKFFFL